ncbi:cytochrome P450 [Streptomyces clavuligerus]|uniref:cytochrome P450 n=1 Tax=Streptomyces clavuligerus TaxID=1901 RepID=UPI001F07526B|nr:cytochrome P450 [Streptomyces clavuligerus]
MWELGGHRFAAGEDFLFSPYQLHHDPAVFPRPGVFDPGGGPPRPPPPVRQAFIPFGTGRRRCIGDTFALAEVHHRPVRDRSPLAGSVRPPVAARAAGRPRFRATLTPEDTHRWSRFPADPRRNGVQGPCGVRPGAVATGESATSRDCHGSARSSHRRSGSRSVRCPLVETEGGTERGDLGPRGAEGVVEGVDAGADLVDRPDLG